MTDNKTAVRRPRVDFSAKSLPHVTHGRMNPSLFVIHTSEGPNRAGLVDLVGMYKFLSRHKDNLWVHRAIDREGNLASGCSYFDICYHAAGVNHRSVGCELIGFAATTKKEWLTTHVEQLEKLVHLIAHWAYETNNSINRKTVVGHVQYGQGIRTDPGVGFPMRRVRRAARYYRKTGKFLPKSKGGVSRG